MNINQHVQKSSSLFYTVTVYPNRVQISDRSGCLGLGLLIPKKHIIPLKNISEVDASLTGMLTIKTNDGRTHRLRMLGMAQNARDLIAGSM